MAGADELLLFYRWPLILVFGFFDSFDCKLQLHTRPNPNE